VKLLRFLQEKCFQRVGGRQEIRSDARVLAATNRNLQESAASGKFREDLYFRLAVIVVKVPPLRERGDDIVLMAKAFLHSYGVEHAKTGLTFAPDALRALRLHHWPGNVRELQSRVRRAVIMADGKRVTAKDLELTDTLSALPPQTLKKAREAVEREMVRDALRRHRGKITSAALELGISRPTLSVSVESPYNRAETRSLPVNHGRRKVYRQASKRRVNGDVGILDKTAASVGRSQVRFEPLFLGLTFHPFIWCTACLFAQREVRLTRGLEYRASRY
jgi:DNA-binding NtrC family response regulator